MHDVLDNGICTTCYPPAERSRASFDPALHPHDPHNGEFVSTPGGAVSSGLKDALKLAGKIDLDKDEKLIGSAKLDGDAGGIRMALTEQGGHRTLRLGLGGDGYGKANRSEGIKAWDGNPPPKPLAPAERHRLENEADDLDGEYDAASPVRKEAIDARLNDIRERLAEDDAAGEFNGTAKLDDYAARRLADRIRPALAEAVDQEKAENKAWDDIDRLEAQREKLRGMSRKWTAAEEAKWDALTQQIEEAQAKASTRADSVVFAEGIVAGSDWGDVHFSVELDDLSVGPQVTLGVTPKGAPDDWGDGKDWTGTFDAAETRQFLRLIDKLMAPSATRASEAFRSVEHHFDNGICVTCNPPELASRSGCYLVDGRCEPCSDAQPLSEHEHALVTALDELHGHSAEAARSFDPAQHPRNPKGSPGGGRFRSLVDRLKDAITEHKKGGGGHPFAAFDREQLRRVAKARGIELKRGEDRDSIAAKLLQHLDEKPAEKPAPKKHAPRVEPKVEPKVEHRPTKVNWASAWGDAFTTDAVDDWKPAKKDNSHLVSRLTADPPKGRSGRQAHDAAPLDLAKLTADGDSRAAALWYRTGDNSMETGDAPGFVLLNEHLRSKGKDPEMAARVKAIDSAMKESKLAEPIVVYRGFEDFDSIAKRGQFRDLAFASATTDPAHAAGFGNTQARILVHPGVGAIAMADRDPDRPESEILLDRNLTYRITRRQTFTDADGYHEQTIVDIEVFPAGHKLDSPKATPKAAPKAPKAKPKAPKGEFDEQRFRAAAKGDQAILSTPYNNSTDDGFRTHDFGGVDGATASDAIGDYGGDGFVFVNHQLRFGGELDPEGNSREDVIARGMDAVLAESKTTRPIVVHRGMGDLDLFGDRANGSLVGFQYVDPAYVSTTTRGQVDEIFSGRPGEGGVSMRILVPAGVPALSSQGLDTDEIVLGRGQQFKVVRDRMVNGLRNLDLEVIPA